MSEENKAPESPLKPIGIKPITIKPAVPHPVVSAPPSTTPPPAPVAPAPSVATPVAPAIKPISLSPLGATAPKPLDAATPTVRLKPIITTPAPAPVSSAVPGADGGIHPPTLATAAKSKTARISLDAALNETVAPGKAAPVGKITSNLTSEAIGIAREQNKGNLPLMGGDSDVTKKKTLRVKPLGEASSGPVLTAGNVSGVGDDAPTVKKKTPLTIKKNDSALPSFAPPEGEQHVGAYAAFENKRVEKTNVFFPICAIAATLMLIAVSLLFLSQAAGPDRSLTQYSSHKTWPSIDLPGKIPPAR